MARTQRAGRTIVRCPNCKKFMLLDDVLVEEPRRLDSIMKTQHYCIYCLYRLTENDLMAYTIEQLKGSEKMGIKNLTEAEEKEFYRLVGKMNGEEPDKKQDVRKYPKQGSTVYILSATGEVAKLVWAGLDYDLKLWNFGNVFFTEKEAEFAREKKIVEVELQRYAEEHNDPCFRERYYILFDKQKEMLRIECYATSNKPQGAVLFTTEEVSKDAIKAVGEDRILKYIFGVESEKKYKEPWEVCDSNPKK